MLGELTATCDAPNCTRTLEDIEQMIVYRTEDGERQAFECSCGAVTITVHR